MKHLFIPITCLALLSLACLSTAAVSVSPTATPAAKENLVLAADQVLEQDTATPLVASNEYESSCAVITANKALHLRSDADPRSLHLAFMLSGEVVRLISKAKADWWLIERGDLVGFARSKYLTESECE